MLDGCQERGGGRRTEETKKDGEREGGDRRLEEMAEISAREGRCKGRGEERERERKDTMDVRNKKK